MPVTSAQARSNRSPGRSFSLHLRQGRAAILPVGWPRALRVTLRHPQRKRGEVVVGVDRAARGAQGVVALPDEGCVNDRKGRAVIKRPLPYPVLTVRVVGPPQ